MDNTIISQATKDFGITGQVVVIPMFDGAIIGYEPTERRIVYNKEKCIELLKKHECEDVETVIKELIEMCKTNRTPLFIQLLKQ